MKVSVIIPTYNRAYYLRESLKSIARQTRPADQVVVVDDGSTDNTADVVQEIQREFFPGQGWPEFRYLARPKNEGKSRAVNDALEVVNDLGDSEDRIVWIFDDDDIAAPDRLKKVVPLFEANPDLDVVHTDGEWRNNIRTDADGYFDDDFQAGDERKTWTVAEVPKTDRLRFWMNGCRWFGISVIWRLRILDRLWIEENEPNGWRRGKFGGGDPGIYPMDPRLSRAQDFDLWLRFIWAGANSRELNRRTVVARIHGGARGTGHTLPDNDATAQATADAEKLIFQKVYDWIPMADIWPGYDQDPDLFQEAYIERAYALFLRGLWKEAFADLLFVDEPKRCRDVHLQAVNIMGDIAFRVEPTNPPDILELAGKIRKELKRIRLAMDDSAGDAGVRAAAAALGGP